MKKLLTLLLTLLMVFTLVGCNSTKEEKPAVVDTPQINEPVQEEIVGGFVDVEDGTLTDELKAIFNKALDGLTGATYEPIELVATQVVAGTNYKFLANGTKTTNPVTKGTYYVTVYEDLNGNVSLLDIETKEEETIDPTKYSYWVVFKNPDGNELQRTIEKYGTTPVYTGDTPVYWDSENWYRFTGWDQELKPITTNAYITAEYEYGGELKQDSNSSKISPTPGPTLPCSNTDTLYYFYDAWQDGAIYDSYNYVGGTFKGNKIHEGIDIGLSVEKEKWYHSSDGLTFVNCKDPNHHKSNMMVAIYIELNQGASMALPDGSTLGSYGTYTKEYSPGTNYNVNGNVLTIGNDQYTMNTPYDCLIIKGIFASGIEVTINTGDSYEDTIIGNLHIIYEDSLPPA